MVLYVDKLFNKKEEDLANIIRILLKKFEFNELQNMLIIVNRNENIKNSKLLYEKELLERVVKLKKNEKESEN